MSGRTAVGAIDSSSRRTMPVTSSDAIDCADIGGPWHDDVAAMLRSRRNWWVMLPLFCLFRALTFLNNSVERRTVLEDKHIKRVVCHSLQSVRNPVRFGHFRVKFLTKAQHVLYVRNVRFRGRLDAVPQLLSSAPLTTKWPAAQLTKLRLAGFPTCQILFMRLVPHTHPVPFR